MEEKNPTGGQAQPEGQNSVEEKVKEPEKEIKPEAAPDPVESARRQAQETGSGAAKNFETYASGVLENLRGAGATPEEVGRVAFALAQTKERIERAAQTFSESIAPLPAHEQPLVAARERFTALAGQAKEAGDQLKAAHFKQKVEDTESALGLVRGLEQKGTEGEEKNEEREKKEKEFEARIAGLRDQLREAEKSNNQIRVLTLEDELRTTERERSVFLAANQPAEQPPKPPEAEPKPPEGKKEPEPTPVKPAEGEKPPEGAPPAPHGLDGKKAAAYEKLPEDAKRVAHEAHLAGRVTLDSRLGAFLSGVLERYRTRKMEKVEGEIAALRTDRDSIKKQLADQEKELEDIKREHGEIPPKAAAKAAEQKEQWEDQVKALDKEEARFTHLLGKQREKRDAVTAKKKEVAGGIVEKLEKQLAPYEQAIEKARGTIEDINKRIEMYAAKRGQAIVRYRKLQKDHAVATSEIKRLVLQEVMENIGAEIGASEKELKLYEEDLKLWRKNLYVYHQWAREKRNGIERYKALMNK